MERCPTCGALMLAGWLPCRPGECAGPVEDAQVEGLTSDGQEQVDDRPMCSCYAFADCEGPDNGEVRCRIHESTGWVVL